MLPPLDVQKAADHFLLVTLPFAHDVGILSISMVAEPAIFVNGQLRSARVSSQRERSGAKRGLCLTIGRACTFLHVLDFTSIMNRV